MSDDLEQRPKATEAGPDEGAEVEILQDTVDADRSPPTGDAPALWLALRKPWEDETRAQLKQHLRLAGVGTLAVVALMLTAVLLAQGLTAALRSTWPLRVAGASDTPDIRLSVETNIPPVKRSGDAAAPQRLAGIQDVSDRSKWPGPIHISPEQRSYLPPEYRDREFYDLGTVITVPASQGRLLRFDEAVESVFIADPAIADIRVVSPQLVYVYGKKLGQTNLLAISNRSPDAQNNRGEPSLTGSARLRVISDPTPANEARTMLAPSAPVEINLFGRRLAVKGSLNTIDQAVDIANIAQTYSPSDQPPINNTTLHGSNQINIRVRFAEIRREDLKSFGIDWNVAVNAGSFSFGLARSGATTDPNLSLNTSFGNFDIDLLIEALQSNGLVTILAEPNLTAVTGETASFLAGGEVPIIVPNGNNATTVQYKPFGVSLSFTPTLVKENRIGLRVKPEVSSISSVTEFAIQGFTLPNFTVRRAETAVEMASGQTFALAGLFQRDISKTVNKLPVLGDVPVLGPLFRSERYQRNETELVILITPYLVNPIQDRRVATPLDRVDPAPGWRGDGLDPTSKGAGYGAPERSAVIAPSDSQQTSGFILK